FCIIVTGNHYWLDAFFGLVALACGTLIALGFEKLRARRLARRNGADGPDGGTGSGAEAGWGAAPAARAT
ncbi:MAG: hypothetical protein ACTHN0_18825, partial [Aquihabitans sp.]